MLINPFLHTIYFSCFPISQLLSTFLFPNNKIEMLKQKQNETKHPQEYHGVHFILADSSSPGGCWHTWWDSTGQSWFCLKCHTFLVTDDNQKHYRKGGMKLPTDSSSIRHSASAAGLIRVSLGIASMGMSDLEDTPQHACPLSQAWRGCLVTLSLPGPLASSFCGPLLSTHSARSQSARTQHAVSLHTVSPHALSTQSVRTWSELFRVLPHPLHACTTCRQLIEVLEVETGCQLVDHFLQGQKCWDDLEGKEDSEDDVYCFLQGEIP